MGKSGYLLNSLKDFIKILLDCLPTRVALQQRGVIEFTQGPTCVFCFRADEDVQHIFFLCKISKQIWQHICEWIGVTQVQFTGQWEHFQHVAASNGGKKAKKAQHLVWIVTVCHVWVIWMNRNKIIFRGGLPNVSQLVEQIRHLSWGWFANRVGVNLSLTYENWCNDPSYCLSLLK